MDKFVTITKKPSQNQNSCSSVKKDADLDSDTFQTDKENAKRIKLDQPGTSNINIPSRADTLLVGEPNQIKFVDISLNCEHGPKQPVVTFPRRTLAANRDRFRDHGMKNVLGLSIH
uniref:Uncharacterized protein n=1 Tax=Cuerna arida TaxID=1464854 RepID=A0A1B6FGJ4_9HEMI